MLCRVHRLSLQNEHEFDRVQAIPVSAELMEYEEHESLKIVDNVSAENVAEAPASLSKYRDIDKEDGDVDSRAIPSSAQRTSGTSDVSGENEQEECLAVLMQLEVSDREVRCPFVGGRSRDVSFPFFTGRRRTSNFHQQQPDGIFAHIFKTDS